MKPEPPLRSQAERWAKAKTTRRGVYDAFIVRDMLREAFMAGAAAAITAPAKPKDEPCQSQPEGF